MDTPVVLFHGFTDEQTIGLMRALKKACPEFGLKAADIAFATSTEQNITWELGKLIEEVSGEHAYMKQNPPKMA